MDTELTRAELRLAELLWPRAPLPSPELVALCERGMGWKKSTTYTMLKRLENKGIFQNDGGTVRACLTREEFDATHSRQFVRDSFGGSLPRFLAAFAGGRQLSRAEAEELQRLIDEHREDKP